MKEFALELIFAVTVLGFLVGAQADGPDPRENLAPDSPAQPDSIAISDAVFAPLTAKDIDVVTPAPFPVNLRGPQPA